MKYTPDFVITLEEDRTVPLLFKTWAIKHFCLEQGFKVDEMIGKYESTQIDEIMVKGHQCYCLYNDLPVPEVSEKDSCEWIDVLGGYNSPKTYEMLEIFMAKALGKTLAEFRELVEATRINQSKQPAKTETEESPNSPRGASSKKSVPKLV